MNTILFVRHGRTSWNDQRRVQGRALLHLNGQGLEQIKALIPTIKELQPNVIYSSPLPRSLESAEILANPLGKNVIEVSDLIELDVGEWYGKTVDELRHVKSWIDYQKRPSVAHPLNGESIANLYERVSSSIDRILGSKFEKALVVTHGDVIRIAICHYIGLQVDRLHSIKVGLASLSIISWGQGKPQLVTLNHLSCLDFEEDDL